MSFMPSPSKPEGPPTVTDLPKKFFIAGVLLGAILIGALLYYSYQSNATSNATNEALDATACRAKYRSAVDDAIADSIATLVELSVTNLDGLKASVTQDQPSLEASIAEYERIRAQALQTIREIDTSTTRYLDEVDNSIRDVEAFLEKCNKDAKGGN